MKLCVTERVLTKFFGFIFATVHSQMVVVIVFSVCIAIYAYTKPSPQLLMVHAIKLCIYWSSCLTDVYRYLMRCKHTNSSLNDCAEM